MSEYRMVGRVQPKHKGAWDANTEYHVLEIVRSHDGYTAYIARKTVPAGTPVTSTEYWEKLVDMADTMAAMQNDVSTLANKVNTQVAIDNAYVEDGYLYLMDGEQIVAGPLGPFSGGAGGGGSANNATLTATNTTGWLAATIAAGAACALTFEWSSLEDGISTGAGTLTVKVGGATKLTKNIDQGAVSVEVGEYLAAGSNTVRLTITDAYGNSRNINYSIETIKLIMASDFDAGGIFTGEITFPYTPTAAVEKTVHFELDGEEIGTQTVTVSGRQQSYTIPAQEHGSHTLRAWFTAEVGGETLASNELYYDLCCTETGRTDIIITSDFRLASAEQYTALQIRHRVYDPLYQTAEVTYWANGVQVAAGTADRTVQTWNYRPAASGELALEIRSGSTIKAFALTVTDSPVDAAMETEGLSLYLASEGRSNIEDNPSAWEYGGISASLTDFTWIGDGWVTDDRGSTALRLRGDARAEIPLALFGADFRAAGKTIEIEFAVSDVLNENAVVLSCLSGGRGIEITARQAYLYSEQTATGTRYKTNERVHLAFVVRKKSGTRYVEIYLNGIISGVAQYPAEDNFAQSTPVGISIGSSDCTTDIYFIRAYDSDLTRYQLLDNWICDAADGGEMYDRWRRNNIYNDYGAVVIDNLPGDLPYMVIECPVLPDHKGDKKTCSGYYVDPVNAGLCFTFSGATIDVQGTSSQYYYRKNWKIKFGGGFTMPDGSTAGTYAMNDGAVPTDTFTFKADVASSEGANNVVLAELYNELCPVKTPPQEADSRVRQTIEGHPIVIFVDYGSGPEFYGKFNFNNDKGTEEIFGFASGDESWEILQNGTDRVGFRSADFSAGSGWEDDFEARYPENNTSTANLAAFSAWVVSCDPGQATGAAIESVTLDGTEYTADSAEYRRAKFRAELADHANVDALVFYYVFTDVFLCIDQREKNAFPTLWRTWAKWHVLFYDADSSLGTDNKGNLAFEYYLEDIDYTDAGEPVFNGQNSVLWSLIRDEFADKVQAEYARLRTDTRADGTALLSYDVVDGCFSAHQGKWPEAVYNEDAQSKYLDPMEIKGDGTYLPMLQGKKELHFKRWMYLRMRYMDSKHATGDSMSKRILIRAHAKGAVTLTSAYKMYGNVYFNAEHVRERMEPGVEYTFESGATGAEDTVIGINDADLLTSLGDLSTLMAETCDTSGAELLTHLKLGSAAEGYSNGNLTSLTLGNNRVLRTVDVRSCPNLTMAVDASGCANLEHAYFGGTGITGLSLPNGGILKTVQLPDTVTSLIILNQRRITGFTLNSYSQITTLRLENIPEAAVPSAAIVQGMAADARVRLLGVEWTIADEATLQAMIDKLLGCTGLDENGENTANAVLTGTIDIPSLSGELLAEINDNFPDLVIRIAGEESYLVKYTNWDGTVLYRYAVGAGGSAIDPVAAGLIDTPVRPTDEQANYTYTGWSSLPENITGNVTVVAQYSEAYTVKYVNWDGTVLQSFDVAYDGSCIYTGSTPSRAQDAQYTYSFKTWDGAASNGALAHVKSNKTVTAVFTATIRSYTIYWYNSSTLLESKNWNYGEIPVYGGETPTYTSGGADWIWTGWDKEVAAVTGSASYYAQFESPVQVAEITDDWETVMASQADGSYKTKYRLGNWIAIDLGSEGVIDYQIVAFDQDDLADGSGKAPITWMPVQLLATSKRMNPSYSGTTLATGEVPAWSYGGNDSWVSNTYSAIADAAATWTITAKEAQTLTIKYKTSNSNAARNTIGITVNGAELATGIASSSYKSTTVDLAAGETATVTAVYSLLSASYTYYGTVAFESTGSFETICECGTITAASVTDYEANKGTGAIGGWEYSEMRAWCASVLEQMPENVRKYIAPVRKETPTYDILANRETTQVTTDSGWIPSYNEVFSSSAEPAYTAVFTDNASRIKKKIGATSASDWWLRSASSPASFRYVGTGGSYSSSNADRAYGVALGFCTQSVIQ